MLKTGGLLRAVMFTALVSFVPYGCGTSDTGALSCSPVVDRVYGVDSTGGVRTIKRINGYFSFDCFKVRNYLLTYARQHRGRVIEEGVFRIDPQSGKMALLINDTLSRFIVGKSSLLTVDKEMTPGCGFGLNAYAFNGNGTTPGQKQPVCFIDIIVNDWEMVDDSLLFLAGSRPDSAVNIIYRLNLASRQLTRIWALPAAGNFMKLLSTGRTLLAYSSTATLAIDSNALKVLLFDIYGGAHPPPRETVITTDQPFAFFGKGFFTDGEAFLPLINPSGIPAIAVIGAQLPMHLIKIVTAPTSLYRAAAGDTNPTIRSFVGYNYFREPTTFYLLRFDIKNHVVVACKKLPA